MQPTWRPLKHVKHAPGRRWRTELPTHFEWRALVLEKSDIEFIDEERISSDSIRARTCPARACACMRAFKDVRALVCESAVHTISADGLCRRTFCTEAKQSSCSLNADSAAAVPAAWRSRGGRGGRGMP